MTTACSHDRIEMSQRERDVLKVMHGVLEGERTQAEAGRLLGLSVRQVRRLQRKLQAGGDNAIVHGLRGKPSNRQPDSALKAAALTAYRQRYHDFGPTFACEKLREDGLVVCPQTLRRWLVAEGLWQRKRRREAHRSRRPRRACFGELIQFDASVHDWLEGRGQQEVVLITLIDDATSRLMARFYPAGTTLAHMDLLSRWLVKYGRPVALYSDRHSIFQPQDKGRALPDAETQLGRALRELDVGLIRAHSPQAKGRVERSFGTAQDRWVKELRLAGAKTLQEANAALAKVVPAHNRRFAKAAKDASDAHRPLGPGHDLASILSLQTERVVSNDYTVRFENRFYQLHRPALPGLRGGRVVVEERMDGSMVIRFETRYLKYSEVTGGVSPGGSAPRPPEFDALAADASGASDGPASAGEAGRAGVPPAGGRSGCTPAEPYPPAGATPDSAKKARRPAENHPWRKSFKRQK
jgi:Helix-turn-helix domain